MPAADIAPDVAAIDAMITAARDHITAALDNTPPGTTTAARLRTIRDKLASLATDVAWLGVDLEAAANRRGLETASRN